MTRKKVEAWAVVDTQYGTLEAFADKDAACAAMLSHMHAEVCHLTEADPLAPLYKRVALAADAWVGDSIILGAETLCRAVSALQRARSAKK